MINLNVPGPAAEVRSWFWRQWQADGYKCWDYRAQVVAPGTSTEYREEVWMWHKPGGTTREFQVALSENRAYGVTGVNILDMTSFPQYDPALQRPCKAG